MDLKLSGVSYSYPGSQVPALNDLSLEVARGGLHFLTGRVGAGCSTALLISAGFHRESLGGTLSGTVTVLGCDPWVSENTTLIGKVGLLLPTPWTQVSGMAFTVFEEVAFGPANLGWDRERIGCSVEDVLRLTGVEHLRDRDPATLSGGELQKVMVAGVLAMEPELLLMDEPAAELDPRSSDYLYEMLRSIAKERAVVVATSDADAIRKYADRVTVLEQGTVIADGTPEILGLRNVNDKGVGTVVSQIFFRSGCGDDTFPVAVGQMGAWLR